MFSMLQLMQPESIEEAYQSLVSKRNNAVLGGCAFLRLGKQRIATAIDLGALQLRYINSDAAAVYIGAMTTLRELELDASVMKIGNGLLKKAVGNILGVQFRNVATVGASVFSKYGFSDLLPSLLALEAKVELHQGGIMTLEEFLSRPYEKDILLQVIIPMQPVQAAYHQLRNSAADFPILNVAVANKSGLWRIAVGARPGCAKLAYGASAVLNGLIAPERLEIESAIKTACEEIAFESNTRASAAYRRDVCAALLRRAIQEVMECR